MRVRRQTVWCFLKRHPDAWGFIDDHFQRVNERYAGLVVRRHALIGMQGSVASAELFLKHQGGHFSRPLGAGDVPLGGGVFHLNLLVPRPDLPGLPAPRPPASASSALATQPTATASGLIPRPPLADIPTIAVSR